MKLHNLFAVTSLLMTLAGCRSGNRDSFFAFDESKFKGTYVQTESASLEILNLEKKNIDSTAFFANDVRVGASKGGAPFSFPLKGKPFGYQNLKAKVYFDGETEPVELTSRIEVVSATEPALQDYKIVATYPHDKTSFTEGFEFYRDTLLEGTGQKGMSYLRKYDYKTGKVFKQNDLEAQYFGEGITVINNKIFELTWQEKTGFIYDANTFKLIKTFKFDKDIEGWGMTNDGKYIYQSDGTEKIWKMDTETQKMVSFINIYSGSKKISHVNELEYINGKIYANVWQKDLIAIIDANTGAVEKIIDGSKLRKAANAPADDVLNGIAYRAKTNTIFVTGKNWDKTFEISLE